MKTRFKMVLWLCLAFVQQTSGVALTPPSTPALSAPLTSSSVLGLLWTDPSGEDGIVVERVEDGASEWVIIASLPANATNYNDTNVTVGQTWWYRVYATNSVGISGYSQMRAGTVSTPDRPPTPALADPVPLLGLANQLNWAPMVGLLGFRVERRITIVGEWETIAILGPDVFSYVDTNIMVQRDYYYRVTAFNDLGDSRSPSVAKRIVSQVHAELIADSFDPELKSGAWSLVSGAQPLTGADGFLDGNALWFGGAEQRTAVTAPLRAVSSLTIEFDFRAGSPTNDLAYWDPWEGGESVTFEYSTNGVHWVPGHPFQPSQGWQHYKFNIPIYTIGTNTLFRWTQKSHSGATNDTWAIDNVVVTGAVPAPVETTSLFATAVNSRTIKLSWGSFARASHYIIQRQTDGSDWEQIASVTWWSSNQFSDTNCAPSTTYAYRIKVVNGDEESDFSQPVTASTYSEIEAWQVLHTGSTNFSITDIGSDGVSYICRYAFNMNHEGELFTMHPLGGIFGLPYFDFNEQSGKLEAVFLRRKATSDPGITYEVQFSDDLLEWRAGGELVSIRDIDYRWEAVTWRDQVPLQKARYCRVAIRLVP